MIYINISSFYNDRFLKDCIKSILDSDVHNECLIDLYIYGADKELINELSSKPNIRVNILDSKKNYSEITNLSIRSAQKNNAEYFMMLNSDTILQKDCVSILSDVLDSDPNVSIVGGYQTDYQSTWEIPNKWTRDTIKDRNRIFLEANGRLVHVYKTSYVQGACMMFRTNLVNTVGYFNEKFVIFYEETEFCRRSLKYGLVGVVEEAKVKHYAGGLWKRNLYCRLRRDVFYLSNQIIYESTESPANYFDFLKRITGICRKQIKNIVNKKEDLTIPIYLYPIIIFSVFKRFNLLLDLKRRA